MFSRMSQSYLVISAKQNKKLSPSDKTLISLDQYQNKGMSSQNSKP